MRAVIANEPGPPDVLHAVELPDPDPGPGQVVIETKVAAITFVDTLIRAGSPVAPRPEFPVVLGNGVAGTVTRVGPDVDSTWTGACVVTTTGGTGGYATHALAHVNDLHRIPDQLAADDAAALLADGRTAVGLHHAATTVPGDTAVITAAAGGVGGILTQLVAASGAQVIALAGSAQKLAHARDLGASVTINYRDNDWISTVNAAAPAGVDVVFDGVGAGVTAALFPLLRDRGRYVQHGAAGGDWGTIDPEEAARRHIDTIALSAIGKTPDELFALTRRALQLGATKHIRPTIGQTFPLRDAAAAHAAIEERTTTGKTLLFTTNPRTNEAR